MRRPAAGPGLRCHDHASLFRRFPAAVYESALYAYEFVAADVAVTYDAVGSGSGRRRLLAGEVHWAGTDSPFKVSELRARPDIRIFPVLAGAVVPILNLPTSAKAGYTGEDLGDGVVLGREVLADIFRGNITRWDDPRIRSENRETLPERDRGSRAAHLGLASRGLAMPHRRAPCPPRRRAPCPPRRRAP